MRLLVTGGAGFIGSAVVRQAVADGHEVVTLDALGADAVVIRHPSTGAARSAAANLSMSLGLPPW